MYAWENTFARLDTVLVKWGKPADVTIAADQLVSLVRDFQIMLNTTVIEGDCEVSLRFSREQPPAIYVEFDRFQP